MARAAELAPASEEEQRRYTDDIAKGASDLAVVEASLNRSIGLLTEYKSSLITAAVTGELDVTTTGRGVPG